MSNASIEVGSSMLFDEFRPGRPPTQKMFRSKFALGIKKLLQSLLIAILERLQRKGGKIRDKDELKSNVIIRFLIKFFCLQTKASVPGSHIQGPWLKNQGLFPKMYRFPGRREHF